MRISKENDELVLRVPLWQESLDADGESRGKVPSLVGIIAGNECSISHLNDLGYKDDIQEGVPLIGFFADPEGLREACKTLGLDVWEYKLCNGCKEPLRGTIFGSLELTKRYGGDVCSSCSWKDEEEQRNPTQAAKPPNNHA